MTLSKLLPDIQQLSLLDKIRLIAILAKDIEQPFASEPFVFDPKKVYYLATPYNTFGAAEILMKTLEDSAEN